MLMVDHITLSTAGAIYVRPVRETISGVANPVIRSY